MGSRASSIRERLNRVREALARAGLHALFVPSSDPHVSEYLPERWRGREWLSGFTGSMGALAVTLDKAALFADSRYWVQAEAELTGTGVELVRTAAGTSTEYIDWLARETPRGSTVAVDGQVLGLATAHALATALDAAGVSLRVDADLLDDVWTGRPPLPADPVYEHLPPHATVARTARLAQLREAMTRHGATHHFISSVDDIAWITNLRGSDVAYNPFFVAHLLLDRVGGRLFVGDGKVSAELRDRLAADGIVLAPYGEAGQALALLGEGATLLLDPARVTLGLRRSVGAGCRIVEAINPSTLAKSRKSDAEAAHVREAMAEDGAAMCEFYAWFEAALGRERITELTVDEKLSAARARRAGFVGLSFATIAGFNANGALPHYRATPDSHAVVEGNGLLLIDSGGQYLGGTTDITRVWTVGDISAAMKRDFTLVLKGMMALSATRFPRGTLAPMLDALARAPLWAQGLDYGHGTGHGVGYFLAVHEGPQTFRKAIPDAHMAMEPGMITSIEPGVYRSGQWGVRIENLVLAVPVATPEGTTFGEFLEFETLTLCPIDTRCIERTLLRDDEVRWLNDYHATVRERLEAHLRGAALAWLRERTMPI